MKINDNGVDRDMTEEEEEQHKAWALIAKAEAKEQAEAASAKAAARQAVLDRLGITADEASLLLG
jgi:multidrug resistance efflux pump